MGLWLYPNPRSSIAEDPPADPQGARVLLHAAPCSLFHPQLMEEDLMGLENHARLIHTIGTSLVATYNTVHSAELRTGPQAYAVTPKPQVRQSRHQK